MRARSLVLAALVGLVSSSLAPRPCAAQGAPARLNRAIEVLASGKPAFGIFSHDRSLENARSLARSGLDFVFIDMEHGPLDVETLRVFLLGMTDKQRILAKGNLQMDVTPIVRIAPNGRDQATFVAKQVLDVGAMGVMFPYVNDAAEAERAIRSVRYPQRKGAPDQNPIGIRGSGPGNATWFWGVSNYQELADVWPLDPKGELLSVIQIETAEAVQNVKSILAVPGISAVFVGPADLGLSLGVSGDAPELEAAIQQVLQAAKAARLPIGITTGPDTVERRVREGFNFVTVGFGDGGITPATARALELGRKEGGR